MVEYQKNEKERRRQMSLKDIILKIVLRQCLDNFTWVPQLGDHLSCKTTFLWQKG